MPPAALATRAATAPLYAAGFVTAFGAHSIAAGLGAQSGNIGLTLLNLGILLALYDVAEVFLKPVFGALSDRVGPKPVIVGGLLAFAALSLIGLWAADPFMLALARLGQGAAASAFSPASSAMVARLAAGGKAGAYFGRYGSWKSLGYIIGPLLGAGLILAGGFALLFGVLAALAAATAVWVLAAVPHLEPLPRPRYTVMDLVRQVGERRFLVPTLVLAASTGALGAAIGFLPALATRHGLDAFDGTAAVSVLALGSVLTQPWMGRLRDQGRVTDNKGTTAGLLLIAAGIALLAAAPAAVTIFVAAAAIGTGIGAATPLGFAHLADSTPPERMGRTMGSAELGRELGDAGGPLLVGGVATLTALPWGLGALAVVVAAASIPRLPGPAK
ncbi:Predicted arabinose efflux permease, MFS family [Pseudarthrobacter enclensis]|uniref:MFS transporter n=1 Tax=Pseudarthrobacter enclensis TaxID=993070 RepID=A0A0V8IVI8_9MICC|nr:MFS transporter [Pseudarthrobacter enclensis]KSU78749.1 MFS transporter [Pseudarthrobacter enclensis]SCB76565.1 Predicted arabinose efflux permease, MFS family [Pseudarthrobacter enclensis]